MQKKRETKSIHENSTVKFGAESNFATREAFNLLRTNLFFSFPEKQDGKGRMIGITSAISGDGKTSVSINLSYSLAEVGNKVLLIEGDMRKPTIAKYLGFEQVTGLSNFLTGNEKTVIHKNVLHENMDVIFAGDIPLDPTILLDSEKMMKALELLSGSFDYIIIDLPPVAPVPDAAIMAKYLDGMLFVVRHGYTRKRDVMDAFRQLKYTKVRMLGFVYNDYAGDHDRYYYKKHGNYYRTHDERDA